MSSGGTALSKARREILAAFDEMQVSSDLLRQFIVEAEKSHPDILEAYAADASCPAFDPARIRWDTGYYSRQKLCTRINFSRARLEHLIEVRDFFQRQQYKGFFIQPSIDQGRDMGMASSTGHLTDGTTVYRPSDNLRKFVEEGEVSTIRAAIGLELNDNRLNRQNLLDALAWIQAHARVAFEPHSEGAFAGAVNHDAAQWAPDYYDQQAIYLKRNFSAERCRHLIDVRLHLREHGVAGFAAPAMQQGSQSAATRSAPTQTPPRQATSAPGARQQPDEPGSVFRLALLIGGALAAAVIYLTLAR